MFGLQRGVETSSPLTPTFISSTSYRPNFKFGYRQTVTFTLPKYHPPLTPDKSRTLLRPFSSIFVRKNYSL